MNRTIAAHDRALQFFALSRPLQNNDVKLLRLFPSIALSIPTANNFTRDKRARIKKKSAFSLRLDLANAVNSHFLENEYGNLSFFLLF